MSFAAGLTYGDLAVALDAHGLALHNLASLPHICVGGAVATATHGSGDGNGNLATAVVALELVTSTGDVVTAARGDPDFDGLVVGLGALGAVTRLTLAVEPAYEVRQHVLEDLPWEQLYERFGEIFASGYSVSVFTDWGERAQLWVKCRGELPGERFGARPATGERHPIAGADPVHCSAQLGRPGPWFERLPHFRMGFVPSAGDELQSEYLLPREHAVAAIDALRGLGERLRPVLLVSEIRTVAADGLWMSPQYGRDSVGFHFTWANEPAAVTPRVARPRGRARAVRAAPALGQAVPGGAALRARGRLRRAGGAARPARRVPQRLARAARALSAWRRSVSRIRIRWPRGRQTTSSPSTSCLRSKRATLGLRRIAGDWRPGPAVPLRHARITPRRGVPGVFRPALRAMLLHHQKRRTQ